MPRTLRARLLAGALPPLLVCLLGACLLGACLAAPASASAAELPEFNLLGLDGGTDITQMNMTTGEFSGTAEISGENFSVTGTETGNKSQSVYTLQGGGEAYESTNYDTYEINALGNVGIEGSFEDTDGHHEQYTGEIEEPEATVASSTTISCSGGTEHVYICTAAVAASGNNGGNSGQPTGNLTFTTSAGSALSANQCVLVSGSCNVEVTPPASGASAAATITAVYSADSTFRVSKGSTTLCGTGPMALTSVTPQASDPDGIVPGDTVTLTGKELCRNANIQFGNEKARATLYPQNIVSGNTSATVTVPRFATTGKVTLNYAGQSASLTEAVTIDSFRNTTGFSFKNIATHATTAAEFEAAFGSSVTMTNGENSLGDLTPGAYEIYRHFATTAFSGGLCFGWVFAAERFDFGELPLDAYDPDASVPWDLEQTGSLESLLAIEFWKQFSAQFIDTKIASLKAQAASVGALQSALESGISSDGSRPDGIPLTMVFLKAGPGGLEPSGQAHEVIAYATEALQGLPGEPESLEIYVSDPNVPFSAEENNENGETHLANVRHSVVSVTIGSQGYSARFHYMPVLLAATPVTATSGALTPWAPEGMLDSWLPPATHLKQLQDGVGKDIPITAGEGEVVADPILDEDAPATDSFTAPLDSYRELLSGNEVSDLLETPKQTDDVEASAGTDSVDFEPATETLSIEPPEGANAKSAHAASAHGEAATSTSAATSASAGASAAAASVSRTAKLTLISRQPDHSERTLSVSGPSGMRASLAHGQVTVTNTTKHAETIHLTLGDTGGTPQGFSSQAITLPASGKLTAHPSWSALSRALSVEIAAHGRHARRLWLGNREHAPAATIASVKVSRKGSARTLTVHLHVPSLPVGSRLELRARVQSGGHTHTVTARATPPAHAGAATVTLSLGAVSGKHARVQLTAITAASGTTATLAKRKRTITLG